MENQLLAFAKDQSDFKTYIMRPAMVLSRETNLRSLVFSLGPSVQVNTFAAKMASLALNGSEKEIWENADINQG